MIQFRIYFSINRIYIIIGYILLFSFHSFSQQAQNYIYNPDFETSDNGNSWPTGVGQCDKMTSWETRTYVDNNYFLHSPDWVNTNGSGAQSGQTAPIHGGSGMIGMANYELIQQNFNNQNMEGDAYYTISMWVYIPAFQSKNSRLKLMFSNNKLKYENEDILGNQNASDQCKESYTKYKNLVNSWYTIYEFDFNSMNIPSNTWTKISTTFRTPSDFKTHNYDFFVMDIMKNNYDPSNVSYSNCQDTYIFIDDIKLEKTEMCGAYCAPNLGNLHFTHELHNGLIATTMPWFFAIENAIGIELDVFDRWGGHVYHQDAFDVNGLKDVGYSDYMFGWMGVLANGSVLQQGVYVFKLKIWNCHQTFYNERDVTYVVGNGGGTQGWDIHNYTLNNCCPDNLYFQNEVISGIQKFGADKFIYAGSSVSSGTQGPVVISGGSSIKFIAGQNIFLSPGFSVAQGGTFEGFIDECYTFKLMEIDDRRYHMETFINQKMYDQEAFITIYPNPNQGNFTIQSNRLKGQSGVVKIYDMLGNVLYEEHIVECSSNQIALHLEKLEKGLYQVSLITNKETIPYLTTLIIN